jgi:phospholipid transport system substrate-binding protein
MCRYRKEIMNRRLLSQFAGVFLTLALLAAGSVAHAVEEAPDALIKRASSEVLNTIKVDKSIQAGDVGKIAALVDSKIMPNVNFTRMTASTVGPRWRQATPEQKKRLQDEFKTLLVRTYAGALAQLGDQVIEVKPLRSAPEDTDVVVRTEVVGKGNAIQLDYRMEKTAAGWKIYDLNVLGLWLVQTYRTQFAQEISSNGLDGLITTLTERNKLVSDEKKT